MAFCIEFFYDIAGGQKVRFKEVFVHAKDITTYMDEVEMIGLEIFGTESTALFRAIGDESFLFMKETGLAYRLVINRRAFSGGIDLFTEAGEMLCRGTRTQLDNFLRVYKLSPSKKTQYIDEIVRELVDDGRLFDVDQARLYLGLDIEASARGFAPDYTSLVDTIHLGKPVIYNGDQAFARVRIKMTGMRSADDALANAATGLGRKPRGYTWHHLDDFDPVTGECTMQLVAESVHMKIITLPDGSKVKLLDYLGHMGSPALWHRFYNFGSYGEYIDDVTRLFR